MTKYAFLYSGGVIERYNYNRYANDLGFAYKVLTEKHHYLKENVAVMYANGSTLQYDNLKIDTSPAKNNTFLAKMDEYGKIIQPDDVFTFVISNHGGENGELFSWDEAMPIQMPDVLTALNKIKCAKIILMGQCYGGNYTYFEIENSIVVSANIPNEVSYCKMTIGNGIYIADKSNEYDEFLYNFFSYCNGSYPCGKPLHCTEINNTVFSAYEYSKNNDFFRNGIMIGGKQYKEIPCIKCNIGATYRNINI